MAISTADLEHMAQALDLAKQGAGAVEPNPLVGCVIVSDGAVVGRGYHKRFGGPHAEIEALRDAGDAAQGADVYVTLEPCCHQGKTGPCTNALIEAGVARVVVGCQDPNPKVAGQGLAALQNAGIEVCLGVHQEQAEQLIAPFTKLMAQGQPWVIAKWAMTLDGKIATHAGSSQWISGEESRALVHQLRGQVDAILVGRGTAEADDPLLTARPSGPRTASRIVLDSEGSLSLESKLVQTVDAAPLVVATTANAPQANVEKLKSRGVEVVSLEGHDHTAQLNSLLSELGRRQMTNLLVEGGSKVLGTLCDLRAIDEVHAFIAPKLVGGATAPAPIGGQGLAEMAAAMPLEQVQVENLGDDVHVRGRVKRS